MPDVSFKPIKGSTAGIAAKPIVNGQILFDTDKKSISLDILLNNVPTRIEMTKQDTFDGTQAEWEALSDAQKAQFVHVNITDDYSNPLYAFTGATSSTDGAAGIVPKPLAGDQNKYLKGDGTWGNPGTTTTVYTQTMAAGETSVTFSNLPTTGTNLFDVYTSVAGLDYDSMTAGTGTLTITYEAQSSAITVFLKVENRA